MKITDTQGKRILPLIGKPTLLDKRVSKRKDPRQILEGVLWILKTGAQWSELPRKYGAYQTVHRRYQEWIDRGVFEVVLRELAEDGYGRAR